MRPFCVSGELKTTPFSNDQIQMENKNKMSKTAETVIIDNSANIGAYKYPLFNYFLAQDWKMTMRNFSAWNEEIAAADEQPLPDLLTLVRDSGVIQVEATGSEGQPLDSQGMLAALGLETSLVKGAFVLSKRMNRLFRPTLYWDVCDRGAITIDYNEHLGEDIWDGAGLVSRRYVRQLAYASHLDLTADQRRRLAKSKRLEVTILTQAGQDKGHVYVVEDLDTDFMFPAGSTKTEVRFDKNNPFAFVSLVPQKAHKHMAIDIQSLINLGGPNGFFQPHQLLAWLQMESETFISEMRQRKASEIALSRLSNIQSEDELVADSGWHVTDFLASGGDPLWFPGMVRGIARARANKLYFKAHNKFRLPVPGCRLYIFPASVGQKVVPHGQCQLDMKAATIWVNDEDFIDYIGEVAGGCDHDDAFWCVPFTDFDGEKRVLAWRSPNQLGEYLILTPTVNETVLAKGLLGVAGVTETVEASDTVEWPTSFGTISWPQLDSRNLPPRIDEIATQYLDLIESETYGDDTPYTLDAVYTAIDKAQGNGSVLGAMCNLLMVARSIDPTWTPKRMAARLEEIIDASVKTGDDLSQVMDWIETMAKAIALSRPIPPCLKNRIAASLDKAEKRRVKADKGNWMQVLFDATLEHLAWFKAETDAIAAEAMPPAKLLEAGQAYLKAGEMIRKAYGKVISPRSFSPLAAAKHAGRIDEATYEAKKAELFAQARHATLAVIQNWPVEAQQRALLGAATAIFTSKPPTPGAPRTDGVLWQMADESWEEQDGFAQLLIGAMRELGLIGTPTWCTESRQAFIDAGVNEFEGNLVPLEIRGVWFNLYRQAQAAAGKPLPQKMGDVPAEVRDELKADLAEKAMTKVENGGWLGQMLMLGKEKDRVVALTNEDTLVGFPKGTTHDLSKGFIIMSAKAVDGNLQIVARPVEPVRQAV